MQRLTACVVAGVLLASTSHSTAEFDFDGCGQIVMGVECPMFAPDGGGLYFIGFDHGFNIGDRVRIVGKIDPMCITFCQQGDGCIGVRSIVNCSQVRCVCNMDAVPEVDVFDLLRYLSLWFAGDQAANLDAIPEVDVHDLLAFLVCWFPASSGERCP